MVKSGAKPRPLAAITAFAAFIVVVYAVFMISLFTSLPPLHTSKTPDKFAKFAVARALFEAEEEKKKSSFPVSINDDTFEEINHPAAALKGESLTMSVPKFWDPPEYQNVGGVRNFLGEHGDRLMTKSEALSIGSTVKLDDDTELETIFVAISSYRDDECPNTVQSIFSRAKYPQRIRVAVVDQVDEGDVECSKPRVPCEEDPTHALCLYPDQIDFFVMDATLAVGPVFARHIGHRMYRGEYYAMQCDAHVLFINNWDEDIIGQWHDAKNEMA
eukprot:4621376-Ditylum_brightwellii.AAC.1